MFADPQSVTLSGTAFSFPRIGGDLKSGIFANPDLQATLSLSHNVAKRERHVARFDHQKMAADVLQPATNKPYSMSTYLVVDAPLYGYTDTDLAAYVAGLTAWLAAGTNVAKLLGGES